MVERIGSDAFEKLFPDTSRRGLVGKLVERVHEVPEISSLAIVDIEDNGNKRSSIFAFIDERNGVADPLAVVKTIRLIGEVVEDHEKAKLLDFAAAVTEEEFEDYNQNFRGLTFSNRTTLWER